MAITTYAELQTAIQNWLDDTSLSSRVTEFIALAEDRINDDLGNLRMAWTTTTLNGSIGSRALTLPTGFVEPRALYLTTDGDQTYLEPFINGTRVLRTDSATPQAWCINGANINLDCLLSAADTFLFHYRTKWDIATDLTNWLLTNHPSVYLASALVEAYVFRDNDTGALKWETRYQQAVERVKNAEGRHSAIAPLVVDPGLLHKNRTFNYTIGE